jgi:peptidoglycan/xylan/chitin deacetylase (PgdA/CDA1 family)
VAFWRGVRSAATRREWRRFTTSSYVVLCYHRLAGEMRPGQERMDYSPRRLRRRIGLLRILGWRPLEPADLVDFHSRSDAVLPRRRFVLSADDAFADAVQPLSRLGWARPQVFAVTGSTGGTASWLAGEPVADWPELVALARSGAVVGSHAGEHVSLVGLQDDRLLTDLVDSLGILREHLPVPVPMLAYPHGRHDRRVRAAAVAAGYLAAYTTRHGRNGAGTDVFCLRRMQPKQDESLTTFLWQVVAGEKRPPPFRKWGARLVKHFMVLDRGPRRRRSS